jgi:hypothetical protein
MSNVVTNERLCQLRAEREYDRQHRAAWRRHDTRRDQRLNSLFFFVLAAMWLANSIAIGWVIWHR